MKKLLKNLTKCLKVEIIHLLGMIKIYLAGQY